MGATSGFRGSARKVRIFEEDPDLLRGLAAKAEEVARRIAVPLLVVEPGPCAFPVDEAGISRHFGLLVLEGVLIRRVTLGGSTGAELLGRGDLLQPWVFQPPQVMPALESSWEVLEPARIAVLDRSFSTAVARWPEVAAALLARVIERTRLLAFQHAASHITGLDGRLVALLWSFADRWGRVTPDGVLVPFRLTHATMAQLVGTSRPSVSTALSDLRRHGLAIQDGAGWLLPGAPPEELKGLRGRL